MKAQIQKVIEFYERSTLRTQQNQLLHPKTDDCYAGD